MRPSYFDNRNCFIFNMTSLHWRHNDHDSVSNHQPHDCFLNRSFRRRSKKTPKLCVTGLCGPGEFPAQRTSNAENVSIWWRHHAAIYRKSAFHHIHNNYSKCKYSSILKLTYLWSKTTAVNFWGQKLRPLTALSDIQIRVIGIGNYSITINVYTTENTHIYSQICASI